MVDLPFIILPCPSCGVKNRVRGFDPDSTPVCAKCKTRLLSPDENEVHAKYGRSLNNFFDLPDPEVRPKKDD
ncbi:MAG: hypothetical protein ACE5E9_06920 [Nitrospinaceae bacterium]